MSMTVYLNGEWLPVEQAKVSVEDRGFMFADGVYEVIRYFGGKPLAMDEHEQRLRESLEAIQIELPVGHPDLGSITDELIARNAMPDAGVYWQITRGAAPRKHPFPKPAVPPTILVMAYPLPALKPDAPVRQLEAVTHEDIRWQLNRIKSIALLPSVLAAQAAAEAGCGLAILVRDGIVTEGSASSVMIAKEGQLFTHPLDGRVLDSITRRIAFELVADAGRSVTEIAPTIDAMFDADEVIALGTTTEVASVTRIDGKVIGSGTPGPIAKDLYEGFKKHVIEHCHL